jgi:hypothetical protein
MINVTRTNEQPHVFRTLFRNCSRAGSFRRFKINQQIYSMLYMVIERFRPGKIEELYKRFDEKGRMAPESVHYVNSWIDESIEICYQVMESPSEEELKQWTSNWDDLVEFEIIPVITSAEAKARVLQNTPRPPERR